MCLLKQYLSVFSGFYEARRIVVEDQQVRSKKFKCFCCINQQRTQQKKNLVTVPGSRTSSHKIAANKVNECVVFNENRFVEKPELSEAETGEQQQQRAYTTRKSRAVAN